MVDMANVTFSPDCRLSVLLSVCLFVCLSGEYTYDWDPVCLRDAIVDVHEEDGEGEHSGYGQCDLLTRLGWNQERTSETRDLSFGGTPNWEEIK